jgi:putative endonuclease
MLHLLLQLLDWLRFSALSWRELRHYALGARAEDIAHRYLQRRGYKIVARNFRPRHGNGEIDIIAWQDDRLVIVEVKSRREAKLGAPERNISAEKRSSLLRAAREYARRARIPWDMVRFDLVSVVFSPRPRLRHQEDVFPLFQS